MLNPGFVTRPDAILPLIASFDIQQDAVIRRLMALRKIPLKILRNQQAQAAGDFGLHSFTLLKSSASELCYGLRGQFWRADFGLEKRAICQCISGASFAGQQSGYALTSPFFPYKDALLSPVRSRPARFGTCRLASKRIKNEKNNSRIYTR